MLANVVMMLPEHDVDWVADCIAWLDRQGIASIEAGESAQQDWMEHVAELAAGTLYVRHDNWYMGSNIPGKRRMFLAYTGGYPGFARRPPPTSRRMAIAVFFCALEGNCPQFSIPASVDKERTARSDIELTPMAQGRGLGRMGNSMRGGVLNG